MNLETELRTEVLKRNKAKFIDFVSKHIAKMQQGEVNLPAFIEAEEMFKKFQRVGALDEYGQVVPVFSVYDGKIIKQRNANSTFVIMREEDECYVCYNIDEKFGAHIPKALCREVA